MQCLSGGQPFLRSPRDRGLEQAGHEVRRFSCASGWRRSEGRSGHPRSAHNSIYARTRSRHPRPVSIGSVAGPAAGPSSRWMRRAVSAGPGCDARPHVVYWLEAAWFVRRRARYGSSTCTRISGPTRPRSPQSHEAWGGPPFSFTAHGPDEFDAPVDSAWPKRSGAQPSSRRSAALAGAADAVERPGEWNKIKIIRCGLDRSFLSAEPSPIPDRLQRISSPSPACPREKGCLYSSKPATGSTGPARNSRDNHRRRRTTRRDRAEMTARGLGEAS